jgi:hypothetical protein
MAKKAAKQSSTRKRRRRPAAKRAEEPKLYVDASLPPKAFRENVRESLRRDREAQERAASMNEAGRTLDRILGAQIWGKRQLNIKAQLAPLLQALKPSKDQGGAPKKLPRGAKREIRRRIAKGEVKIPSAMMTKYPGVMGLRAWQLHVSELRHPDKKRKN